MRSTTSSFKTIVRSDWRHNWPAFFLYVFLWCFLLPVPLWNQAHKVNSTISVAVRLTNQVYGNLWTSIASSIIAGVVLAMLLYSYLMKSNSTGLMHALPITRPKLFFAHFTAGMSMATAGNVLIFLLSAMCVGGKVSLIPLLWWLYITELTTLFFFAFGALCAMLTGWLLAVPVAYFGLNFVVKGYAVLLDGMKSIFYFGYASSMAFTPLESWLTPIAHLLTLTQTNYIYDATPYTVRCMTPEIIKAVAVYAVVALPLLALGCFLYTRRHSETAGDAVVFPWLKPIAKYIVSFAGGLGLGFVVYTVFTTNSSGSDLGLILCQVAMGALTYCAVEMLLQKRFAIFHARRTFLGLILLTALIVGTAGWMMCDLGGFEKRIPEANTVKSITLRTSEGSTSTENSEAIAAAIAAHEAIVEYGEAAESKPSTLNFDAYDSAIRSTWLFLDYELQDGSFLRREYTVTVQEDDPICQAVNALYNAPAVAKDLCLNGQYDLLLTQTVTGGSVLMGTSSNRFTLTPARAEALRQALLEDTEHLPAQDYLFGTRKSLSHNIEFTTTDKYSTIYLYDVHPDLFPATDALLQEYGFYEAVDPSGQWVLDTWHTDEGVLTAIFGGGEISAAKVSLRIDGDCATLYWGNVWDEGYLEQQDDRYLLYATDRMTGDETVFSFTRVVEDGVEYLVQDAGEGPVWFMRAN